MFESRLARIDDAPRIARLQATSWESRGIISFTDDEADQFAEATQQWEIAIRDMQSQGRVLVVEIHGEVVGFAAISVSQPAEFSELVALEVDPTHRREGIGSRLINAAADIAVRMNAHMIRAWVEESEIAAQTLLRETGWATSGATRVTQNESGQNRNESEWITYLHKG